MRGWAVLSAQNWHLGLGRSSVFISLNEAPCVCSCNGGGENVHVLILCPVKERSQIWLVTQQRPRIKSPTDTKHAGAQTPALVREVGL